MKAPIYVKVGRYKEVEETINQIKAKINETREILGKLGQLKSEEEHEMHRWAEDIKHIEDKIEAIQHSMAR